MDKQERYDRTYLRMAQEWSNLSHCTRKQVGALIVKNGMIISDGYNGTPTGFENTCEVDDNGEMVTKWYVLHGEANAILKCARHGHSCDGSTLYQTHSPCKDCSKLILQSGIKRLVYIEEYKDITGLEFLREAGVEIKKYDNV
jgi:dCMP deaminase